MTQSDKGLAKIAVGASPRLYAEISPYQVKDTHLMNDKLPQTEILCGECNYLLYGLMSGNHIVSAPIRILYRLPYSLSFHLSRKSYHVWNVQVSVSF